MKIKNFFILTIIAISSTAFAEEITLVLSNKAIQNLDKTILEVRKQIHFNKSFSDEELSPPSFVNFPEKIPAMKDKLYSGFSTYGKNKRGYVITIDYTPDCHSKLCNAGSLLFQQDGNPIIYYDRENKIATVPVTLHKGIQGFYTRGFAMADYWHTNIQWRDKEVLYTLTWNNPEDKDAFIKMANSVY